MRVHASLSRLQPVTGRSLIDAGELLSDFSRIWGLANLEERKRLLRASLEAAYIEKSAITAVKPRPEFYNLIYRSGGPDGGRYHVRLHQTTLYCPQMTLARLYAYAG